MLCLWVNGNDISYLLTRSYAGAVLVGCIQKPQFYQKVWTVRASFCMGLHFIYPTLSYKEIQHLQKQKYFPQELCPKL